MDDGGMTDVPMKLLISAVMLSLLVPVVVGSYSDLSCTVAEDRALREMSRITKAARSVIDGDVGSTLVIELEIGGFGNSRFQRGTIGGPMEGEGAASSLTIVFEYGTLGEIRTAPDPPIRMTSEGGSGGFVVLPGTDRIEVTHVVIGGVHAALFVAA